MDATPAVFFFLINTIMLGVFRAIVFPLLAVYVSSL